MRPEGSEPGADASHVVVFATLGAPERRRQLLSRNRRRTAEPEPEPTAVITGRATVIDVGSPFAEESEAKAWLSAAGEDDLSIGLAVLNRALHAFRLVTADPYLNPVDRDTALVARVGFGDGEQVAEGLWTAGLELELKAERQRRGKILVPQARLAAVLSGRERALASEELTLRARLDLDHGREREAAFQVLVALDAALAEMALDPTGPMMPKRLSELEDKRDDVAAAAQMALSGPLDESARDVVDFAVRRLESLFRARALVNSR
jgi:hypothetical protein